MEVLSIIVPVYNVEKYLCVCVDSLLKQDISIDDYEIILVDDGSTDNSGTICDEYAEKNGNIRVIHQVNSGLSAARNRGLELAEGQYIMFVDSDDFLEQNIYCDLITQIKEENLDILRFNYENVDENGKIIHPYKNPKVYSDYGDEVVGGKDFMLHRLGLACYAWQFIIRTDIAKRVPFLEGIRFEDTEWVTRLFPIVARISSTDTHVYNYRIRIGSITKATSIVDIENNLTHKMRIISIMKQRQEGTPSPSWYDTMITLMTMSILWDISDKLFKQRKMFLNQLDDLEVFPVSTYSLKGSGKLKVVILNISPILYCDFMHFTHKI